MKSLKSLLIPVILLVLLLIGTIVIFATKKDEPTETSQENIFLLQLSPSMVSNIEVDKNDGSSIAFQAYADSEGVIKYSLVGEDDSVSISQNKVSSYIGILCNVVATSSINAPSSLTEYGLDNPEYTVRLTATDGSYHVFYIGSQTYDKSGCYIKLEGDANVYITAAVKRIYADYKVIDFLESQLLNIDYSQINTIQFDRETDNTHIVTNCYMTSTGDPAYDVVEPYIIGTSPYFENLIEYVATLEIAGFVDIPEDQIADYGLDNPTFHFKFTMDSGEVTDIYFSSKMNEFYYGYCTGIDGYFQINALQVRGLETPLLTLLDSYISYYPASTVSKITLERNNVLYDMELDVDSAISDVYSTVTLNSRNMMVRTSAGRSYAAMAFESFATIQLGGIALDDTPTYNADDVVLKMTVYKKDYTVITYEFIARSDDSYYVFTNGSYSYFYVSGLELFRNSGTDTYSYGVWEAFELANYAIDNQISGVFDVPDDYGVNN